MKHWIHSLILINNSLFLIKVSWRSSEVAGISEVSEPISRRGASQPARWGSRWGERRGRSSIQTDWPAGVPSLPPDVCGIDDGAADGHHHLPPHLQTSVSDITSCLPPAFYFSDGKTHRTVKFQFYVWIQLMSNICLKDENWSRCAIKPIVSRLLCNKRHLTRWCIQSQDTEEELHLTKHPHLSSGLSSAS